jgi:hypothetical protein
VKNRLPFAAVGLLLPLGALAACGSAQSRSADGQPLNVQHATVASAVRTAVASAPSTAPSCGPQAAETLARTAGQVAMRIYALELASREVSSDKRQVETYGPLLSALEGGNRTAIGEAVTSLVFSHTHVVRLRVTRGSQVLADVGGPQILAPVHGTIRRNGRVLGHYVLSVQDDLGYIKLVTRFIGVPLVLSAGSHALSIEGAVSPGPPAIPTHGAVSYRGKQYQAFSFAAQAFPSGGLRISLLVPVSGSPSTQTCFAIKVGELGRVAERISRRFRLEPSNFGSYIKATGPLTGGLIYIRSGSHQLAGSSQPGPAHLPNDGSVRYRGSSYGVSSFTAPSRAGQVRIYQLIRQ